MSTEEFLIANQDISDENALLYKGQEVVISYINPIITIVEETHSVKKESIRYKTIEKTDENLMPGHYEELIRKKRCIDITKYYELDENDLETIYNFLKENKEAVIRGGIENLVLTCKCKENQIIVSKSFSSSS